MPSRIRAVRAASSSLRSQKLAASTGAPYRNGFSDSTERYYSDCYNTGGFMSDLRRLAWPYRYKP